MAHQKDARKSDYLAREMQFLLDDCCEFRNVSGGRRSPTMKRTMKFDYGLRARFRSSKGVRACLMCGRVFRSDGPHNRRCPRCNYLLEHAREGTYYEPRVYSAMGARGVEVLDVT